jgi:hypothetical protein
MGGVDARGAWGSADVDRRAVKALADMSEECAAIADSSVRITG